MMAIQMRWKREKAKEKQRKTQRKSDVSYGQVDGLCRGLSRVIAQGRSFFSRRLLGEVENYIF